MVAAAPTSTPQVGCAATSSLGCWRISRPRMNFCRLPPDRLRAGVWLSGVLTPKRRMISSASVSTLLRRIRPLLTSPCWKAVSSALSARLNAGTAPWPRRSAGTKLRPSLRRASGCKWATGSWPKRRVAPSLRLRRCSPLSKASSSSWPLPATPAMPTISPLRTSRLMSLSEHPNGSGLCQDNPCTSRNASPPVTFG
ncbi:hypothetical protein D3C81_1434720 [compost metagenome]